ncbi:PhzF family phenazine biosynthesis protein [Oculatella sp. LEGE 06141]|uniref:PhzF family phenazine biosynthesis isomerase n=1 Tax=Oculatella sp. LEGE 06141 TaxID=1828648 RepID=UPI00187EA9CC|nr:PhzF family phenazine biosynthesis protein [Oculatella sp. LEGE 06141]
MGLIITQVDAFTDTPFTGNPAAVCVLPTPQSDRWMQNVAREMNLSETAFLLQQADGYSLRWFTPTVEVDLCGHATLASAHVLWSQGHLTPAEEARFHTRSGLLTAKRLDEWIELNFPAALSEPALAPDALIQGLGVPVVSTSQNPLGYLVEVNSEASVRQMQPDFSLLKTLPVHGVIVTSRADQSHYDFVSRFFAPAMGIDEDPVTGSAHCCLAPYWHDRLNQSEFMAYQASARGGVLNVRYQGDRVLLRGKAVTVLRGDLSV